MDVVVAGIVSALATGAGAGLKDTAKQVVTDAYHAVKTLVTKKYPSVNLAQIEAKPESEHKRNSLTEDLAELGAADDTELIAAAQELIAIIEANAPEAEAAIGVDLADITANALNIGRIRSEGTGVKVHGTKVTGNINIHDVTAGQQAAEPPDPR